MCDMMYRCMAKPTCRKKITRENNMNGLKKHFCEEHIPKNLEEFCEDGCFICIDKITDIKDTIVLKCNHIMHKNCYFKILNKKENNVCPICRHSYGKHKKSDFKKKYVDKWNIEDCYIINDGDDRMTYPSLTIFAIDNIVEICDEISAKCEELIEDEEIAYDIIDEIIECI